MDNKSLQIINSSLQKVKLINLTSQPTKLLPLEGTDYLIVG